MDDRAKKCGPCYLPVTTRKAAAGVQSDRSSKNDRTIVRLEYFLLNFLKCELNNHFVDMVWGTPLKDSQRPP